MLKYKQNGGASSEKEQNWVCTSCTKFVWAPHWLPLHHKFHQIDEREIDERKAKKRLSEGTEGVMFESLSTLPFVTN